MRGDKSWRVMGANELTDDEERDSNAWPGIRG